MMMGVEKGELAPMVGALLQTNLAEMMPYDHLRLHPALGPYLAQELTAEETAHLTARWADGMRQLTRFLYNQQFQDAKLSATLTRLELPNLLHLLETLAEQADAETTLAVANKVEQLLADLDHPRLLKRVVAVRKRASRQLGDGLTDVRFETRRMEIERLLQAGQVRQAVQAAQQLLANSQGPGSQVSAPYQAMAVAMLGEVLFAGGAAREALIDFQEAQRRFEQLGEEGARMAATTLDCQGKCLAELGRLEEAAQVFEQATKRFETLQDKRSVAVSQGNLATVRLAQGRYAEAVAGHQSARQIFAELGEPRSVATAWHQIGMVHEKAGNDEAAEEAYRESLALWVKHQYQVGEAATLLQLGNLYDKMGRLEGAVTFYRQAADVYVQLQDLASEGRARGNLADTLIKLERYDEARAEIERAMECAKPYGHAAEPWKMWEVLRRLERAVGDPAAAEGAKAEARRLFLAYRRDGGENHTGGGRLCADFLRAMQAGQRAEMAALLPRLAEDPGWQGDAAKALVSALQAILRGSRDPALAENPALPYDGAAEVQLLLEALGPG
jgi:tetratricopeptide (TPR) repeat protein